MDNASATTKDKVVTHGSTMVLTKTFIERISMVTIAILALKSAKTLWSAGKIMKV